MKKSILVFTAAIALATTVGSASAQHREARPVHQRSSSKLDIGDLVPCIFAGPAAPLCAIGVAAADRAKHGGSK
jgi:hypothetical protein